MLALGARIAVLTIVSLLASPIAPLVEAQAPPVKSAASGASAGTDDWPRAYSTASGAALVIYQPQVAIWANQKDAVLYAAVSYTANGAAKPALGTLKVETDTSVAVDDRLVSFSDFKITEPNFRSMPREQLKTVLSELAASLPLDERVIELDRVLANINHSQITPKNVAGVKADPPPVFFSKCAAVLVNLDGEPIWAPIGKGERGQHR